MPRFRLEIVTPDRAVLDEEVDSLIVPAWDGYLGVLAGHAPLLSVIRPGHVTVSQGGNVRMFLVGFGFLEVGGNRAILLADQIESADAVSREAMLKSKEEVKSRIARKEGGEKLEEELERADRWSRLAGKA